MKGLANRLTPFLAYKQENIMLLCVLPYMSTLRVYSTGTLLNNEKALFLTDQSIFSIVYVPDSFHTTQILSDSIRVVTDDTSLALISGDSFYCDVLTDVKTPTQIYLGDTASVLNCAVRNFISNYSEVL